MDDELLKRFNALRAPTSEPVEVQPPVTSKSGPRAAVDKAAKDARKEDDDLAALAEGRSIAGPSVYDTADGRAYAEEEMRRRMRALRGDQGDGEGVQDGNVGNDEVEAYLAKLSSSETAEGEDDQPLTAAEAKGQLEEEARAALDSAEPELDETRSRKGQKQGEDDGRAHENDSDTSDDGDEVLDELETEEEIVARALAEASLERTTDPPDSPTELDGPHGTSLDAARPQQSAAPAPAPAPADDNPFSFPSLPTHMPAGSVDDFEPIDQDTQARMDLLLGLSGPALPPQSRASKPGPTLPMVPKRQVGQGWNLPGYNDARDQDLDAGVDADIVCAGCDDDLYCNQCWREGHEVEKHRARKFVWGRGKLVGAA